MWKWVKAGHCGWQRSRLIASAAASASLGFCDHRRRLAGCDAPLEGRASTRADHVKVIKSKKASEEAVSKKTSGRRKISQDDLPESRGLGTQSRHLSVFSRSGERVSFEEIIAAAEKAEVVLLGETHDDPVAHQVELYLWASLLQRKSCCLSLEMFEADVQTVIDEYLAGHIQERDMLKDARPWSNYHSDYRFLLECAKDAQVPVIAANVPRRYVGAVGREGASALSQTWPQASLEWMPPAPLPAPSKRYEEHIDQSPAVPVQVRELGMSASTDDFGCPYMRRPQELKAPIMLWDSGMAYSIARRLKSNPGQSVVHVCGVFHVECFTGICEMLSHYRPNTRQVVVAIYPEDDCHTFVPGQHGERADFVILTDSSLPRSFNFYK